MQGLVEQAVSSGGGRMSLKVIHLAAEIENTDDFHVARLLLLLNAAAGRSNKPVQGIMKLAKMDFLLRYGLIAIVPSREQLDYIPSLHLVGIEARVAVFSEEVFVLLTPDRSVF